jgi:electron transport complex protein RnfE
MDENKRFSFREAITENPVLFQCVGLCSIIAGTSTLKDSLFIAVMIAADLIVTCTLASLFFKKIPRYVRIALYLVIGLAIIYPVLWYIETRTLIEVTLGMRIIIPLIAVNSVTAVHCETYSVKHSVGSALADALSAAFGTALVAVICGTIREIIGKGTVGGYTLDMKFTMSTMSMPFGCLVLLGFLAAIIKALISLNRRSRNVSSETEAPEQPEEIDLGIEQSEAPETVDMIIADYDDIDSILSSTDEFLRSLNGYEDGGDEQ